MKGFRIYQRLINWRTVLVLITCSWLIPCEEPVNLTVPIVQARADRSAQLDFNIKKAGEYQFALLFSTGFLGNNYIERQRQIDLFGDGKNKGEVIPVSLRLIKDGKLFSDEKIETIGTARKYDFHRRNRKINAMVRNVKILNLPTGHYSSEITLLKDIPEFDQTWLYAHVIYFTPENLARVAEQYQTEERESESQGDWYMVLNMAGSLLHGVYCMAFCPDLIDIVKPIDITLTGQTISVDFKVSESANYQFSLLFDRANDRAERERRARLFGHYKIASGVPIPLLLRVTKNGKVFYENKENTVEVGGWTTTQYQNRSIDTAERRISRLELSPGNYSVVITTLEDIPEFNGIESFIEIMSYQHI